jgi:hypothetical protein
MRVLVVFVTTALVGLVTVAPGASAQTGFTGFEASSTGLISEEGFVSLGTTFECATARLGATVSATLEQQHAAGTSTAFAFGGHQPGGGFCAPAGAPLALGFGLPSGPPFERGTAVLSMQACVGAECRTAQQTVKLRDGGRTIEASLPPDAQSVLAFGVPSTAVLETTGVVTVGTAVSCASVSGPGFSGTLEQRHGSMIAKATAADFLLGGCGARLHPLPVSFIPVADSVAFKPGRARISLTVCAGRVGDYDCATVDGRMKLVKAK